MSQQGAPFKMLWQYRYPFPYWYNRLEKINPYNEHDKLEALYSLIQLSDIYAHVFAAYAQNPELPWFFLKENTYRGDIDDVLDELRTEGMATVGTLSENPDGLVSIEPSEEYDLEEKDAIAGALLGCPFSVDQETGAVEFEESPELHRGVANAILNFAEENKALLNDFKHGFRILPVSPEDIEEFIGSSVVVSEEDEAAFQEVIIELKQEMEEESWGFCFIRMHTKSKDYGHDIQIDIYHVDAWACYKFAELTLDALKNLIGQTQPMRLEEALAEVPISVVEGDETIMQHVMGFATPVREDPERAVSDEEFRDGNSS